MKKEATCWISLFLISAITAVNQCDNYTVRWRIDFEGGGALPSADPADYYEGQPSTIDFTDDQILFPGDGVTFQNRVHTITYWIVDCAGNVSLSQDPDFYSNTAAKSSEKLLI